MAKFSTLVDFCERGRTAYVFSAQTTTSASQAELGKPAGRICLQHSGGKTPSELSQRDVGKQSRL